MRYNYCMFTNIDEAVEWITNIKSKDRSFDRFKNICNELGNPQNDFYLIHVGGTDGKGSTVSYLCSMLMEHGFKVGTLTSPHFFVHQDRIRINDQNIDDKSFLDILNRNYDFYVENGLSMFEIVYLMMCEYFKKEKVDIVITEVGLGGTLDSTNVVDNTRLSIITTIGFDHMDRLGNTLLEICSQKCGIIKDNSKVLIGYLNEDCNGMVEDYARRHKCKFYELEEFDNLGDRRFRYQGKEYEITSYAAYQLHNAALAVKALQIISEDYPFELDYEKARKGLKKAIWHGRFEIVRQKPLVIIDGAHNIHGVSALVESFDQFKGSKCIVFSALERKDYKAMIDKLVEHCDRFVITTFPYKGAIDINEFKEYDTDPDYKNAIDQAIKNYDNILICGSLYFLSEVVNNYKF